MSQGPPPCAGLQWVRPELRALKAYAVTNSRGLIKLDAMENPYRWPEELIQPWLAGLRQVAINRYPDPQASELKEWLRTVMEVPAAFDLLLGNGSDELIQLILLALAAPGRTVVVPEPSFAMYRLLAVALGFNCIGVPLRADDFALDYGAMITAMRDHEPAVVFLAYPNNPTGNLWERQQLCELIETAPGLVVIDEAYLAFAKASLMPELSRYANLLVLRTLSKLGLAGLRLGFLIGSAAWLAELEKVRLPYNINVLTQASARFALQHYSVLQRQVDCIVRDREHLLTRLRALPGVVAWPSSANFILFRSLGRPANAVFEGLCKAGILVKNLHGSHPLLANCLRVSIGLPAENKAFLEALAALL
ncbi:MAG: histidinol-phosphate transaminase [Gammaproteobacteria bacterium]